MESCMVYLLIFIAIISLEIFKWMSQHSHIGLKQSNKNKIVQESWSQYNVRVHARIPIYNGPNPFVAKPTTSYETFKFILFTMTGIAPLRVFLFLLLIFIAYLFSIFATLRVIPIDYRNMFYKLILLIARTCVFVMGFYYIPVIDSRTDKNIKPRCIVSNHHTIIDGFILMYYFKGCIAAKIETSKVPLGGQILTALKTLFIDRNGKNGREQAKQQIIDHINNKYNDNSPPLIIFPQGTTTNISTLTTFKVGAFLALKPVLPILLHWNNNEYTDIAYVGNKNDLAVLYYMACNFINYCRVEILDSCKPSSDDPLKYADKVRMVMAKRLNNCVATPHSLSDALLFDYANQKNIDWRHFIMNDIVSTLKLKPKTVKYLALRFNKLDLNQNGYIEYDEFCAAFDRDPIKHSVQMSKLFTLFTNNEQMKIGFDEFLCGVSICFVDSMISDAIKCVFNGCSINGKCVAKSNIMTAYKRQVLKYKFKDNNEYNKYYDEMQLFVDKLFDFTKNENKEMKFDDFYSNVINKNLQNDVQKFLQLIIMMRLKIKLSKKDFSFKKKKNENEELDNEENNNISVHHHPQLVRSDSIQPVK